MCACGGVGGGNATERLHMFSECKTNGITIVGKCNRYVEIAFSFRVVSRE